MKKSEINIPLKIGDVVAVKRKRGLYMHYGIFVGNNSVVHFSGLTGDNILDSTNICVIKTSLQDFLRGDDYYVEEFDKSERVYSRDEIVMRALSNLGEKIVLKGPYDLANNNCEHFVHWCATGCAYSGQINFLTNFTEGLGASPTFVKTVLSTISTIKSKILNK